MTARKISLSRGIGTLTIQQLHLRKRFLVRGRLPAFSPRSSRIRDFRGSADEAARRQRRDRHRLGLLDAAEALFVAAHVGFERAKKALRVTARRNDARPAP